MTPSDFYDKYLGYAKIVQSHFDFNSPNIFLAQWALETAWGESILAQQYNNLAGINYNGVACYRAISGFAGYTSLDNFILGYIHVLSINGYGYPEFLATKDGTFAEQAHALGASDWAASHYDNGSGPGSSLAAFEGEFPSSTEPTTPTPSEPTTPSSTEPTTTPTPDPTPTASKQDPFTECYDYTPFTSTLDGVEGVRAISLLAWGVDNVDMVLAYTPRLNNDANNYKAGDVVDLPSSPNAPVSLRQRVNSIDTQPTV